MLDGFWIVRYGFRVMTVRHAWPFFLLLSCGGDSSDAPKGPNRPPVVDSLDSSIEVAATSGRYVAPVIVKFHDDDGDAITKLRVRIPDGNYDETTVVQRADPRATGATVTMDFDAKTVAAGTYEYFVSVFDAPGLESEAVSRTITFK